MPDHNPEVLKIYRLLSPENQVELLSWVNLAYTAENSVRKSLGYDVQVDIPLLLKTQENSCKKSTKRRKK